MDEWFRITSTIILLSELYEGRFRYIVQIIPINKKIQGWEVFENLFWVENWVVCSISFSTARQQQEGTHFSALNWPGNAVDFLITGIQFQKAVAGHPHDFAPITWQIDLQRTNYNQVLNRLTTCGCQGLYLDLKFH